jgi:hypothetical protein
VVEVGEEQQAVAAIGDVGEVDGQAGSVNPTG